MNMHCVIQATETNKCDLNLKKNNNHVSSELRLKLYIITVHVSKTPEDQSPVKQTAVLNTHC